MIKLMLSCGRYVRKELLPSKKTVTFLQRNASNSEEEIHIPKRIKRGTLSVLQSLAEVVKPEPGVTESRFQYGGIFDSNSGFGKRLIAMSMDSGRKAAKWVVAQNPKLFQHKIAEPYVKAFAPPNVINENTPVSEEILLGAIEDVNVEDAIKLYKLIKEKNIDVSMTTKQLLLEMVCYYNSQNRPDMTLLERKHCEPPRKITVNTWLKDGFAEELFSEMEPNSESYSTLVLGKFKYNNVSEAMTMCDEGKENGVQFSVDVYNALLEHAAEKAFQHKDQEAYIIGLLKEMKKNNIEPNIGTLNSTLKSITAMRKWLKAKNFAVAVYQEFTGLGINPSLATYYYLLEILAGRNKVSATFKEILDKIENQVFFPEHPDDFLFFNKAMDIATYDFKSISLAHRVHNLLMVGSNICFLSGGFNCQRYYSTYLGAAFRYGDLNEAVDMLERLYPQSYMPEIIGVLIVLGSLKNRNGSHFLPKIWPLIDEVTLKSNKAYPNLLNVLVDGMSLHKDNAFIDIAKTAWDRCNENTATLRNSDILTSFLKVFALGEEKALSDAVFTTAVAFGPQYIELDFESLYLYADLCSLNDDKKKALACVEYLISIGHERVSLLADRIRSKFHLEDEEEKFLDDLLKTRQKEKHRREHNTIQVENNDSPA